MEQKGEVSKINYILLQDIKELFHLQDIECALEYQLLVFEFFSIPHSYSSSPPFTDCENFMIEIEIILKGCFSVNKIFIGRSELRNY